MSLHALCAMKIMSIYASRGEVSIDNLESNTFKQGFKRVMLLNLGGLCDAEEGLPVGGFIEG